MKRIECGTWKFFGFIEKHQDNNSCQVSPCVCVCVSEHTSIRYNLNLESMVMEISNPLFEPPSRSESSCLHQGTGRGRARTRELSGLCCWSGCTSRAISHLRRPSRCQNLDPGLGHWQDHDGDSPAAGLMCARLAEPSLTRTPSRSGPRVGGPGSLSGSSRTMPLPARSQP